MESFFRICDCFGIEFHWNFKYRPKYYTSYGGMLSILSFIFCIFIFIIFGLDDFKRKNPISTISNNPPLNDKTIQSRKNKLYIPWRIMDYGRKFINYNGVLFPRIYFFTNKQNEKTGQMETFYEILNYTLCNETSMRYLGDDFLINLPLDNLYCIDMENITIGGSWNSDFVNYIRLDLNLCKDGLDYNESNINCTPKEYLNSLYGKNNNWFIELLYPSVQYQPYNKTLPIFVIYTSHYYGLSVNSNKVDRIFLQEHVFADDKGWILNQFSNVSYWGVSAIKSDYYTIGERDIFRYGSTSRLYSLKLYVDFSTVYYTRNYKKLFEILSELFPIIRFISYFFYFIAAIFKKIEITKQLNELIIEKEIKLFKNERKNNNKISFKFSRHLTSNSDLKNKKISNIVKNKKISNIVNNSSQFLCINNLKSIDKNHAKNEKKIAVNDYMKTKTLNNLNSEIVNENIFDMLNNKKYNFHICDYFMAFFLNKLNTKRKNNYLCISEEFDFSYTLFTHIIDISFYISLYQQFQMIKKLVIKNNIPNQEINKIEEKRLKKKK